MPAWQGPPANAPPLSELAQSTALIAYLCDTRTLDVRAGIARLEFGGHIVEVLTVDVIAADVPSARRMADMLRLAPRPSDDEAAGEPVWHAWTGWVPGASAVPFSVRVAAAEVVTESVRQPVAGSATL